MRWWKVKRARETERKTQRKSQKWKVIAGRRSLKLRLPLARAFSPVKRRVQRNYTGGIFREFYYKIDTEQYVHFLKRYIKGIILNRNGKLKRDLLYICLAEFDIKYNPPLCTADSRGLSSLNVPKPNVHSNEKAGAGAHAFQIVIVILFLKLSPPLSRSLSVRISRLEKYPTLIHFVEKGEILFSWFSSWCARRAIMTTQH